MDDKKYIVLECSKYTGLTLRSGVAKPGTIFIKKNFRGDDEDFNQALKDKRFKEYILDNEKIEESKHEKEKESKPEKKLKGIETKKEKESDDKNNDEIFDM